MGSWEDAGWHDERHCPPWCVTTNEHLQFRVDEGSDDYWHQGVIQKFGSVNTLGDVGEGSAYLSQRVHSDERGTNTLRAEIVIETDGGFTPTVTRELVDALNALAEAAEADTEWQRSQGFKPEPL